MNQKNRIERCRILCLQLFALCLPPSLRVGDMILVIDRQSARDGISIQSSAVLEGCMWSKYREFRLQLRLQRIIVLLIHLAATFALQGIFYLGACILHHAALGSLVKKLGGTNLYRPTSYTI